MEGELLIALNNLDSFAMDSVIPSPEFSEIHKVVIGRSQILASGTPLSNKCMHLSSAHFSPVEGETDCV